MTPANIDEAAPIMSRQERLIAAPLDRVWAAHVAVARWPRWQKDIQSAEIVGPLVVGGSFQWRTTGIDDPITSTVYAIEDRRRTLWGGPAAGIDGVHEWRFSQSEGATLVTTQESWAGDALLSDVARWQEALDTSLQRWLQFMEEYVLSATG